MKVYQVVEQCSLPGDSKETTYSTQAKAVKKFEETLDDDIKNTKELLRESEYDTIKEFREEAMKSLSYSFDDQRNGVIWVTEVKEVEVL